LVRAEKAETGFEFNYAFGVADPRNEDGFRRRKLLRKIGGRLMIFFYIIGTALAAVSVGFYLGYRSAILEMDCDIDDQLDNQLAVILKQDLQIEKHVATIQVMTYVIKEKEKYNKELASKIELLKNGLPN
jgi:hypothetical protein